MISVVVPVYNVRDYLGDCADSILSQTNKDIECILIDDGSTDGSSELCDEIVKKDSRIKVVHKPNGGLSDARNAGLDVATGEYVTFVDSDDVIYPNALQVLLERMEKDNLDVVTGNVMLNDLKTGEKRLFGPLKSFCDSDVVYTWRQTDKLLAAMFNVAAWNKLYKREVFEIRRFIRGIKFEDVPMWTDILFSGARIGCVDKPVYQYNVNREGSIVTTRDYRGYPDAWVYQRKALEANGLFKDGLANDFIARIVMKFIQAYNLSSPATRKEFYLRVQSLFRGSGKIGLDGAHGLPIAVVEYIHFWACKNLPHGAYKMLFGVERILTNPAINSWLKRTFQ